MKIRLLYIGNLLARKGYTPTTIDTLSESFRSSGYTVYAVSDRVSTYGRMLEMIWTVLRKRNQTDYVLIDTYSTLNFYYAYVVALLCQLFKLRYIPILHGGALPERLKKSPQLCQQLFGGAYKNVAPSLYLYQAFKEFGLQNLEFIPNSIDLEQYPVVKKNYANIRLLWVRSFAHLYHPMMAIEVLKQLRVTDASISLTMVGPDKDGSLEQVKAVAIAQQLPVTFTGKLAKKEWITLSKEHHIFINTTNFDNTPVSVMEAMALGFPIVSTDVGGIPYLIDHGVNGLLVAAGDIDDMVNQIKRIIEDDHLRGSLIANALMKAQRWDWKMIEKQWRVLLQ